MARTTTKRAIKKIPEQPIEKLAEEVKEMEAEEQPAVEPVSEPEVVTEPLVEPAIVEPVIAEPTPQPIPEPIIIEPVAEQPESEQYTESDTLISGTEYVLVNGLFDCIGFANLSVKIENTGTELLAYEITGGNKEIYKLPEFLKASLIEGGAVHEFTMENLSWKYIGIYAKCFAAPSKIKLFAEPQKPY